MVKIKLEGKYEIKFRAFGITFKTVKGSINETVTVDPKLHMRKGIDLGPVDLVIDVENTTAKVHVVYQGFPVYTHSVDIKEVLAGKVLTIPNFNQRGVKVEGLKITLVK